MRETCPCCGHRTLPERGAYDLCPVCWWEDDAASTEAEAQEGPNGTTLAEGQRLYQRYGSSALHGVRRVRAATSDEPRDPAWEPLPSSDADPRAVLLRDTGQLLEVAVQEALVRARRTRTGADVARFDGLREAYVLLVEQADGFGIPRTDVGVDADVDLERDLRLDPPGGYVAG